MGAYAAREARVPGGRAGPPGRGVRCRASRAVSPEQQGAAASVQQPTCPPRLQGNRMRYYAAANSLLDAVLINREGLPITLALLLAAVRPAGWGTPALCHRRRGREVGRAQTPLLVLATAGGARCLLQPWRQAGRAPNCEPGPDIGSRRARPQVGARAGLRISLLNVPMHVVCAMVGADMLAAAPVCSASLHASSHYRQAGSCLHQSIPRCRLLGGECRTSLARQGPAGLRQLAPQLACTSTPLTAAESWTGEDLQRVPCTPRPLFLLCMSVSPRVPQAPTSRLLESAAHACPGCGEALGIKPGLLAGTPCLVTLAMDLSCAAATSLPASCGPWA